MNLTLEAFKAEGHLVLVVTGDLCRQTQLPEYARSVHTQAARHGSGRVLLDERLLSLRLDVYELFYFAQEHAMETPLGLALRCALVCSAINWEMMKSLELFLQNRAFDFQVFLDLREAEAWLMRRPGGL